ncbi:MAG TPA: aminoglycoside phosphotransferase family protein, partial [Caulobacteraceae bacterium]|nr:aminoglycoside phosphotransferase family protein [Caulobacteraceae bacterium]
MSRRPSPEADVDAALAVAANLGLGDVQPVVLKVAHHTSVHLKPWPIVARVDSSFELERMLPFMRRELDVARHLAGKGAPSVRPARDPSPGPYAQARAAVTLWELVEHRRADGRRDDVAAGRALAELHRGLSDYPGVLPQYTEGMETCSRMLDGPETLRALTEDDRRFLAETLAGLRSGLAVDRSSLMPLHGDAHPGNVMVTPAGAIWADLETACLGPLEWELTSLPPAAHAAF